METTRRTFVLGSAWGALAALACGKAKPPAPSGKPGVPTHDEMGRPVLPHASPTRRLISLAPNVTELLFAIGAGDQLVGIDRFSDQPAGKIEHLVRVGTNFEPSLETIVGLRPDLVLLSKSANRRDIPDALERLGVPAFVTVTPALADLARTLRALGALTGHSAGAEDEIARCHAGFERLRAQLHGRRRPRVLVAVWPEPLFVAGRGTFTHDLVELAGGENVAAEATGFVSFPIERVLHLAPEVIVLPTHGPEANGPGAVAYWSRWPTLPAVRTGRVYGIEDAIISRAGARLVEGAERLARLIHPQL